MSTKAENLIHRESCLNKAQFDEPLFILRAKDPLAAQTVRLWAAMASTGAHSPDKVASAVNLAEDMEAWRKAQPTAAPEYAIPRNFTPNNR